MIWYARPLLQLMSSLLVGLTPPLFKCLVVNVLRVVLKNDKNGQ